MLSRLVATHLTLCSHTTTRLANVYRSLLRIYSNIYIVRFLRLPAKEIMVLLKYYRKQSIAWPSTLLSTKVLSEVGKFDHSRDIDWTKYLFLSVCVCNICIMIRRDIQEDEASFKIRHWHIPASLNYFIAFKPERSLLSKLKWKENGRIIFFCFREYPRIWPKRSACSKAEIRRRSTRLGLSWGAYLWMADVVAKLLNMQFPCLNKNWKR